MDLARSQDTVNVQKSIVFLYTRNNFENKKKITKVSNTIDMKYLGI